MSKVKAGAFLVDGPGLAEIGKTVLHDESARIGGRFSLDGWLLSVIAFSRLKATTPYCRRRSVVTFAMSSDYPDNRSHGKMKKVDSFRSSKTGGPVCEVNLLAGLSIWRA